VNFLLRLNHEFTYVEVGELEFLGIQISTVDQLWPHFAPCEMMPPCVLSKGLTDPTKGFGDMAAFGSKTWGVFKLKFQTHLVEKGLKKPWIKQVEL